MNCSSRLTLLTLAFLLFYRAPFTWTHAVPTFSIDLNEQNSDATLRTYDFCSMIHALAEGFNKISDNEIQQAIIREPHLEVKRKKEIACYLLQQEAHAALQANLERYTNEQLCSTYTDCDSLIQRLAHMQNNDVPLLLHMRYHIKQIIAARAAQGSLIKACCIAAGISAVVTWCVTKLYTRNTKPAACSSLAVSTAHASPALQQHPQETHQEEAIALHAQ